MLICIGSSAGFAQKNKNKNKVEPAETTKVLTAKEVEVISYYYDGTTQKLLGNYKEALNLFLTCIAKDPKNAGAYYEIGNIYNTSKQPNNGVVYAKTAAELDPKNKWFLAEYADLLIQTGKIKQASKVYDQLLKIEPNNQDYQLEKADILIYLKQYKGAIDIYNRLEKKLGIVPEIILQKQKLYLAQGKYDAAEKEMQTLIEKYPNEPEYYGMFAEFYLTIKKKEKAMDMFQKVLDLDPTNPIIHLAMANYYQENNQNEKAYEYIKLAFYNPEVEVDNKIKIMLSYYDLSANNAQRKTEANELMGILIEVHPTEPKVWSMNGDFLLRDEKIDEAILSFEKVVELQGDKYPVWEQLLQLYLEKDNYNQLQIQSAKAIELFPSMPMFYYFNGLAHFMKNNYSEALTSYKNGKDLVVNDINQKIAFLVSIAETNTQLKKYSDADAGYESALSLQGNNLIVLISYSEYLCLIKKDIIKARELSSRAKNIEPRSYEVVYVLALIEFKSKNNSEALNLIKSCLDLGGGDFAKVSELYGDILFASGDPSAAIVEWEKAKTGKGKYSELLDQKIQQKKLVE